MKAVQGGEDVREVGDGSEGGGKGRWRPGPLNHRLSQDMEKRRSCLKKR